MKLLFGPTNIVFGSICLFVYVEESYYSEAACTTQVPLRSRADVEWSRVTGYQLLQSAHGSKSQSWYAKRSEVSSQPHSDPTAFL